ncbi:prolyl oligopeptidase family serine peptidase [Microbispora sp. GKU 823]|uniref:prolyl oligopeptidase family serine peptidase n=1 Tax=Microbispora sp. GKU 823 TaxID=1652100 RepID=UPI0009A3DA55|nr:prolyl oligopeptidase family serine peptidase [Microbispora sp. GKU 823]OPG05498.1 S9 family peptidase [Microbispora sp. GKU 823]
MAEHLLGAVFPGAVFPGTGSPDAGFLEVWGCWTPALAPDRRAVAYVSDRDGAPRVWVQPLEPGGRARVVDTGPEPVADVSWSPAGDRLAVLVAPGGGEHTQVWTVRADGGDLRPLAAPEGGSAWFAEWTGRGDLLLVTEVSAAGLTEALLIDAATGSRETVAAGPLLHPEAVSRDHARVLLRCGPRGVRRMYVKDLSPGGINLPGGDAGLSGAGPSLPGGGTGLAGGVAERPLLAELPGSTEHGVLSPGGGTAYLLTDAGRDRAALVAVPVDGLVGAPVELPVGGGREGLPVVVAERPDAELDRFALTVDGRRLVLVWNTAGRSELEVLEAGNGPGGGSDDAGTADTGPGAGFGAGFGGGRGWVRRPLPAPPGEVVSSVRLAPDGRVAVLAVEGPAQPSHVVLCDLDTGRYLPVAGTGPLAAAVGAELVRVPARDGLELSGWLYRPPGVPGPAPYAVFLHGGPEDQERPVFTPLYQCLVAAGIGVFAPNVRGSAGFGRAFRDADNHALRFRAIDDVADCAAYLVRAGLADSARLACLGWSYGGYLTLAALVTYPRLFRAGVDVCGMADFATFYERTEPWIAAAAVSEYGHPEADRDLLHALSPLHAFDRLTAPLLVVHGARDTNVPAYEAEQVVRAARARGVPCELLLFEDEGHEIRRRANRVVFVRRVTEWLGRRLTGASSG